MWFPFLNNGIGNDAAVGSLKFTNFNSLTGKYANYNNVFPSWLKRPLQEMSDTVLTHANNLYLYIFIGSGLAKKIFNLHCPALYMAECIFVLKGCHGFDLHNLRWWQMKKVVSLVAVINKEKSLYHTVALRAQIFNPFLIKGCVNTINIITIYKTSISSQTVRKKYIHISANRGRNSSFSWLTLAH